MLERNGQSAYLMLCSITDWKGTSDGETGEIGSDGRGITNSIQHSLRRGDSFTKYSLLSI
ncbi:MAG: hypothetical protein V8R46_05885 [Eubacterium ramulus]